VAAQPQKPVSDPHAGHETAGEQPPAGEPLPAFIPPVTDEDRRAAFPDVDGHATHDNAINYFVLVDQLEWEGAAAEQGFGWDTKGWVGRDRDRVWFRTEGQQANGRVNDAQSHVFYGRQISRWWDVLVGVRQDFDPGPAQTWAAVGIQGLAPYWFDVEATAYVGANGRNHYRFETTYEFLLTNRLILQPQAELEIYGKPDLEHERDKGLATLDFGFRLRYLIRRELAPYAGVVWHQKHFGTADLAQANGESTGGARFVAGLRFWM
jgi:copper resistance protein B